MTAAAQPEPIDELATALTRAQAAEALHISERSLQREQLAGRIPHIRLGRAVYFSRAALNDYIERNSVPATVPHPRSKRKRG